MRAPGLRLDCRDLAFCCLVPVLFDVVDVLGLHSTVSGTGCIVVCWGWLLLLLLQLVLRTTSAHRESYDDLAFQLWSVSIGFSKSESFSRNAAFSSVLRSPPAPRPLDLFALTIEDAELKVDTGNIIQRQTYETAQVVYP